jgi:hypothetical protein
VFLQDSPFSFQLQSAGRVEFESALTWQGPCSVNSPCIDELPGPPFNQMVRGAFAGSLRASKNQKNCSFFFVSFSQSPFVMVVSLTLLMG